MYYVYKHTAPNGKVYIGITRQIPERRWRNGNGYDHNKHFFNAIIKYGWDNFKHEILYSGLTKEEAEKIEISLIAEYKSNDPEYGYNIESGGFCATGIIPNEETRKKLSKVHKGKPLGERQKENISKALKGKFTGKNHHMYGKHQSEETKKRRSESLKGHIISDDTKLKIGNANSKSIICLETNKTFISIKSASESVGVTSACICAALRGKRNTAGGYHWLYVNQIIKQSKK